MSEEMHEIHEQAETGHHEPAMAPVSITMAVLAVLVAISSLLVHRSTTRAILFQSQASDLGRNRSSRTGHGACLNHHGGAGRARGDLVPAGASFYYASDPLSEPGQRSLGLLSGEGHSPPQLRVILQSASAA